MNSCRLQLNAHFSEILTEVNSLSLYTIHINKSTADVYLYKLYSHALSLYPRFASADSWSEFSPYLKLLSSDVNRQYQMSIL